MIRIDLESEQLWRDDAAVRLRRKTWQVLRYLIDRGQQLVTKGEILDAVWPDMAVEEKVVGISIREIRQALGDQADEAKFIETVHGRGFRLLVDLREYVAGATSPTSSCLVGRSDEIDRLRVAIHAVSSGRGQLVAITGEAGIGKSSLIDELPRLTGDQATVLVGRCFSGEASPPFWPWVEILEAYVQTASADVLRSVVAPVAGDLGQLSPGIRAKFSQLRAGRASSQESGRARMYASVVSFLRSASSVRPLVVVIEDLHDADASTLSLLTLAARNLTRSPVCFAFSYRNDEPSVQPALRELIAALERETTFSSLTLGGLEDEDVSRLVANLGATELPQGVVSSLAQRTAGNPFFIGQIIKHWIDLGLIGGDGDLRSRIIGTNLPLPPAVVDTVRMRLERLTPAARDLLARGAVAGNELDMVILAKSGLGREKIAKLLDEAFEARLLRQSTSIDGRFEFAHALIAEVVRARTGQTQRHQLHLDAAQALSAALPSERHLPRIARHYFEAAKSQDVDAARLAVEFASRAGQQAAAVFAFEQAAGHFEMALQAHELSRSDDEVTRCRLLVAHADALLHSHRLSESKERFERAAALARRLRLGKELALGVLGQTVWNLRPQPSHAADIGAIEDALELLGDRNEPPLRARLMARLATTLTWHGDMSPHRLQLSDAAVDLARASGDRHAHALVLADRLWTLWDPDHLHDRLRAAAECVELAQAEGTRVVELYARGWQLLDLLRSGDLAAADAHLEAHTPLVEEIGQGGFLWAVAMFRATRATLAGEFDVAEARIQEAFEIGRAVESTTAMTAYGLQLTSLRRAQGRLQELKPMLDMMVAADSMLPLRWLMPVIHAEMGDEETARAAFEEIAADDFRDLPLRDERLGGFGYAALLGDVCAFLGDSRRASMLYDLLRPYATQWIVISVFVACFGSVSRVLGKLAATAKRWAEAEVHFEDALRAHAMAPPLLAQTRLDYAAALLMRPGRHRHAKARSLLKDADATACALGMAQLHEQAEALAEDV